MRSGRKGISVRPLAAMLIILSLVSIAAGMAAERLGLLAMALALGCASAGGAGLWYRSQRPNARSDRQAVPSPTMSYRSEVPSAHRAPPGRTELEVRWNQRSFRRNILILVPFFLAYLAIAAFASGTFRLIGVVVAIELGVMVLFAGPAYARRIRRRPVAATLNEFGVTFDRHGSVGWEIFREVRFGLVKPRLLFVLRPLHYIAFVPQRAADLPRALPGERLKIRIYGTNLLLMTETVTPSGDDILAAVARLSDVPVRR